MLNKNKNYLSYYKMTEMEDMPRDNYKNKKILIDDDEPQDTNNNEIFQNNQIGNKQTSDVALNVQTKSPIPQDNQNYFISSFYQNFIPNIVLLSGLLILILTEIIYKDALFNYSLTYEQNLQESLSKGAINFFSFISITGDGVFIGLGLFFIFCYFSLIKTILISVGVIFMIYLHDLLKLIYSDPRPFWLNTALFQGKCETSYGNPSGHSLLSFFFYLSFSYYLCQINKIKSNNIYKISIYCLALFIAALTAFSRLALGVHSVDQVLYGSLLGIFSFLIFAFMFKIYDMPLNDYLKFFKKKNYINGSIITNILLIIFPFILYALIDVEKDKKRYELVMSKKCPDIDEYKLYSHNCLGESLIILLISGIYCGQFLFWYLVSKKKDQLYEDNININKNESTLALEQSINNWNIRLINVIKNVNIAMKIFGIFAIILIPGIFYLIIPGENNSLGNIFAFKIGLPLFFIGFLGFGPCLYGIIHVLKE